MSKNKEKKNKKNESDTHTFSDNMTSNAERYLNDAGDELLATSDLSAGQADFGHFLSSEINNCDPKEAMFHVIPVPYEYSVSYMKGTKYAPAAILAASQQLELYESYTETIPANKGIHTQNAVTDTTPQQMLLYLAKATKKASDNNAVPVVLGGEHSITAGALKGLLEKYPNVGILHFDAHADLRDTYEGSKWSHACAMARVLELNVPLVQFGTRAYSCEELKVRKQNKERITAYDAKKFINPCDFLPSGVSEDKLIPQNFPEYVYISVDADVLDISLMPHTGTPVAGGLQWYQLLELIRCAVKGRQIIGFDLVELAPSQHSEVSEFAVADLAYKIMGLHINNLHKDIS